MRAVVRAIAIVACVPISAHAGRSHFGWQYGSEINPARGVELENWIIDVNDLDKPDGIKVHETQTWFGIVFALSEHAQMAIAVESEYADDHVTPASTNTSKFGADVRWRPQDPGTTGLANLFRIGVKRLVQDRAGIRTEANIVTSYETGDVFTSVDLGFIEEHTLMDDVLEWHPGIGVSARVVDRLRLGAEVYGEITVIGPDPSWVVAGPTVSLTSGRLWGAATLGVGVLGIRDAGRITIGVVL